MTPSPLYQRPVFWLIVIGLVLLALWYSRRPTADNRAILSPRQEKALEQDLQQQAARRRQDSLATAHADTAAATLYHHGRLAADSARRLHQRTHETTAPSDTSAAELQRELTGY
ncbi:hypothetical protein E5K00_03740 [Hymenobacter aquaticus]|uniref:Uncharacterized protein n=1 Tax=Hymenobacter aquaticus TaxID=1867101 RepID=A0A4Z0Q2M1_9BACT|nr:hypothetical protein [Hymenobacter aquaticus]TGE24338.1 hypothetical protein E5K00_03740 [Hymenobacter aquaticus]